MLKDYLIVEKSALPDYFLKVVEARRLLESGACQQVSGACEQVGISRSTYYKYKDKVIEPTRLTVGRKAVLMLMLDHESGVLSKVLASRASPSTYSPSPRACPSTTAPASPSPWTSLS